ARHWIVIRHGAAVTHTGIDVCRSAAFELSAHRRRVQRWRFQIGQHRHRNTGDDADQYSDDRHDTQGPVDGRCVIAHRRGL
ncbi:MAG: hypothetical protein H7099_05655, partial [Gemmatimonadaceae bacterium]|nr:hypothetical protein [Gemmatimonadaceae bacterium]